MKRWQRKVLLASLTGAMWLTAPVSALADVEEGSAAEVQQEVTADNSGNGCTSGGSSYQQDECNGSGHTCILE